MNTATFDIGTTAVKGVLVSDTGEILLRASVDIHTCFEGNYKEQDPEEWYRAFLQISADFIRLCGASEIGSVIMSGQMQDVIPVDEKGNAVRNAVLYSDGRAEKEAERLCAKLGRERIFRVTGNHCDGSLPLPKMMWLKEREPDAFRRVFKVLISAKDYIILKLTGQFLGDVTACATSGAMDIRKKCWNEEMLQAAGMGKALFPEIRYAHEPAGTMSAKAADESGYAEGTTVYVGTGDAGATTLASGIASAGEFNINLGTSGWVATVSKEVFSAEGGVFNLAAMPENMFINVVPFLNAGNVHKWIAELFSEKCGEIDYQAADELLRESVCGSHGLLFLPYIVGERFPVLDARIKGCFYGITPETKRADLLRSCLEGVAFSVRQGIEQIGQRPKKLSVIGGGGRVSVWCQILSDVLKTPLYVYKDAEILPALALSAAVLLGEGKIQNYESFTEALQAPERSIRYEPDLKVSELYDEIYERYLRLYPALKKL